MKLPIDRFMKKVSPEALTGCWLWTGATQTFGYGKVTVNWKSYSAHRLSWILHKGEIPAGMSVLHHCDNPACVSPSHLFLGSQFDNMKDMARKGRSRNQRAGATHCIHGHEFTPENTYTYSGQRMCKTCVFTRTAFYRQQRKALK